jgi:hypothetical protein
MPWKDGLVSMTRKERLSKNNASRNDAEHFGEPWTGDELDELCKNWDGTDETLEVIAYCLGRTIEGCRQRYYEHLHGASVNGTDTEPIRSPKTRQNGKVTPTFRAGWLYAVCDVCRKTKDVYMDQHGVKLCEDCEED